MENFSALGLPQPLLRALEKMNFSKPTPIQAKAVPLALEGRDILGSAQTGTGKTAAFGIPMIAHVLNTTHGNALVMTPTRELAAQVQAAIKAMLSDAHHIKTALLIGGDSMFKQISQLRARPRIIIGTPGRINDHLQQGILKLADTNFLVLDETDRMLDMGFDVQIEKIIRCMPQERQTLLFSATIAPHITKLSEKYLNKPERIAVGSTNTPVERIQQDLVHLSAGDKYGKLIEQITKRTGSIIVFVKTKRGADRLAEKLNKEQHSAEAIHGNLSQGRRTKVIQSFRDKKHRIMVATDVAARGLDIPHIEHVINYDLPQQPEDYIHRLGRTARAGAEGSAVCFITPEDRELWREIHFLMNPSEKPASLGRAASVRPLHSGRPKSNGAPRGKKFGGGRSSSSRGGFGGGERSEGRSFGGEGRRDFGGEGRHSSNGEGRRDFSGEGRREQSSEGRRDRWGTDARRTEKPEARRFARPDDRRDDRGARPASRDGNAPRRNGNGEGRREFSGEGRREQYGEARPRRTGGAARAGAPRGGASRGNQGRPQRASSGR